MRVSHNLMLLILALSSGGIFAQVRITDPVRGSYVSGAYQVVVSAETPEDITRTALFVDGREAFARDGWHPTIDVDFGEEIVTHDIYVAITLKNGTAMQSSVVRTRDLEINVVATSEIILLTAVVKTRKNDVITGLEQKNFTVLENGQSLPITSFYNERLPLDLVFLLDTSSSLRVKGIDTVKAAASAFLQQLDPTDRVNLWEFKTTSIKRSDFTTDSKQLLAHIENIEARGETALFDTLHEGLGDLKGRRQGRKALVLFTDGRDSVYEEPGDKARLMREAITMAQNQEVTIFTIGLGSRVHQAAMERMALETGGRFFAAEGAPDLHGIFAEIVSDLKHQYVLGVAPQATGSGFQRLDVRVNKRRAQVYARKGYTR